MIVEAIHLDIPFDLPKSCPLTIENGKLQRFEFLGRTYVSVKEVMERRMADVWAGRPRGKHGAWATSGEA